VSMGEGEAAPDPPRHPEPTVLVVASKLVPIPVRRYEDGFRAVVSSVRQNSGSPISRLKSASYLANLLARREARDAGSDEALLLNERGRLCEGSSSNVFLVRAGRLYTPDDASGCLAGITRAAVMEIAADQGIPAAQREIELGELFQADEAFITNSVLEVMPLAVVDDKPIGGGGDSTTRGLMAAYRGLVAREVGEPP